MRTVTCRLGPRYFWLWVRGSLLIKWISLENSGFSFRMNGLHEVFWFPRFRVVYPLLLLLCHLYIIFTRKKKYPFKLIFVTADIICLHTDNYIHYTSDALWKSWLVESIQSIHNSLWTWHDKCNNCCRYCIYHVKFNVCLVTKALGVFSSETEWLNRDFQLMFIKIFR